MNKLISESYATSEEQRAGEEMNSRAQELLAMMDQFTIRKNLT